MKVDATPGETCISPALLSRCMGRRDLASRVLKAFASQTRDDVAELRAAVAAGRHIEVARLAHRIKGAAANVSLDEIHGAALELELLAKQGDSDLRDGSRQLEDAWSAFEQTWSSG